MYYFRASVLLKYSFQTISSYDFLIIVSFRLYALNFWRITVNAAMDAYVVSFQLVIAIQMPASVGEVSCEVLMFPVIPLSNKLCVVQHSIHFVHISGALSDNQASVQIRTADLSTSSTSLRCLRRNNAGECKIRRINCL